MDRPYISSKRPQDKDSHYSLLTMQSKYDVRETTWSRATHHQQVIMLLVGVGNPDNPKKLFTNDIIALINNICSVMERTI
jgi:hypothetical protein